MPSSFLLGWDQANDQWVRVLVDADGHLYVDQASDSNVCCYGWDSANQKWVDLVADADGHLQVDQAADYNVLCYGWDSTNGKWVELLVDSSGYLQVYDNTLPDAWCKGYDPANLTWVDLIADADGHLQIDQAADFVVRDNLWHDASSVWVKAVCNSSGEQYIDARNLLPVGDIPVGASMVRKSDYANNATVTLYTVPTGKHFYLINITIAGYSSVSGDYLIMSKIYDSGGVKLFQLASSYVSQTQSVNHPISFPAFYRMGEGEYITLESDADGAYIQGSIWGFEL